MDFQELETEALALDVKGRACLAGKLLESLESLSPEESAWLWAEVAQQRDAEMDVNAKVSYPAEEVFRNVRAKLS